MGNGDYDNVKKDKKNFLFNYMGFYTLTKYFKDCTYLIKSWSIYIYISSNSLPFPYGKYIVKASNVILHALLLL